ncbi:unannotated protein [freshwater metagenome]|uniref:Unannotated protein n=1 Tax=freshwater metagenome TaxID=449393 RepID=A0A6J7L6L9_9ZZZZ
MAPRVVVRPIAVDDSGFSVERDGERFRVRGDRPARWVRQTDFSNDEAVGYLADRLARLGVEDALAAAGALRGDEVLIGTDDNAVVFEFDPSVRAGAEILMTRRGEDSRLDRTPRRTTIERRAARAGVTLGAGDTVVDVTLDGGVGREVGDADDQDGVEVVWIEDGE